jgi:hypothetical protein
MNSHITFAVAQAHQQDCLRSAELARVAAAHRSRPSVIARISRGVSVTRLAVRPRLVGTGASDVRSEA